MALTIDPTTDRLNKALASLRSYLAAEPSLADISIWQLLDAWVVPPEGIACTIAAISERIEAPGPEATVTAEVKPAFLYPDPEEGEAYMRAICGTLIAQLRKAGGLEIQGVRVTGVEYGHLEVEKVGMFHAGVVTIELLILRD